MPAMTSVITIASASSRRSMASEIDGTHCICVVLRSAVQDGRHLRGGPDGGCAGQQGQHDQPGPAQRLAERRRDQRDQQVGGEEQRGQGEDARRAVIMALPQVAVRARATVPDRGGRAEPDGRAHESPGKGGRLKGSPYRAPVRRAPTRTAPVASAPCARRPASRGSTSAGADQLGRNVTGGTGVNEFSRAPELIRAVGVRAGGAAPSGPGSEHRAGRGGVGLQFGEHPADRVERVVDLRRLGWRRRCRRRPARPWWTVPAAWRTPRRPRRPPRCSLVSRPSRRSIIRCTDARTSPDRGICRATPSARTTASSTASTARATRSATLSALRAASTACAADTADGRRERACCSWSRSAR